MERQRAKARASWAGSGEAAQETVWFALREKARRHRIPRLRDRERRRRRRRAGEGRQGSRRAQKRRDRRGGAQPDAVLRRDAAARSATPARCGARACSSRSPTRRRRPATCSRIWSRSSRARSRSAIRCCSIVDHARRWRHPAEPFRHASSARGAAPGARRSRRAEGLAGRARPAAFRLLASQADDARRSSRRVEDIANDIVLQNAPVTTRLMALDDAHCLRRARAVRREIRRRGARGGDGRGQRQYARLVGGTVRRHACAAAPATSA